MKASTHSGANAGERVVAKSILPSSPMYNKWRIELQVRDRLYGGVPRNKEMIRSWVESRTGFKDKKSEELTKQAVEEMVMDAEESGWVGFKSDERGLYLESRAVKAMLRESFTMLQVFVKKRGSKQIYQHGMEVRGATHNPLRIYMNRQKPDGSEERPIHVSTAQGPRTSIKKSDYVEQVTIAFDLWVLATAPKETRTLTEEEVKAALTLAQENGLGGDRSQQHGKFNVTKFEAIETGTMPKFVGEKSKSK